MISRFVSLPAAVLLCGFLTPPVILGGQIPTKPAPAIKPIPVELSASCKKAEALPEAGKNGYTNPRCISCRNPSYTDEAFRKKIQGVVVLKVIILPSGKAHSVCVVRGLDPGLDQAAEKVVDNNWRLKPALGPDGKPAEVRMLVEIDFHLH